MNERIKELAELSGFKVDWQHEDVQAQNIGEKFLMRLNRLKNISELKNDT